MYGYLRLISVQTLLSAKVVKQWYESGGKEVWGEGGLLPEQVPSEEHEK